MVVLIGIVFIISCVLGSYYAMGGEFSILWQPFEMLIVFGSAMGAMVISQPNKFARDIFKNIKYIIIGSQYKKKEFIENLVFNYNILNLLRKKGPVALEEHVDKPEESDLFKEFPSIQKNETSKNLICDSFRMVSMGVRDPNHIDTAMSEDISHIRSEQLRVAEALHSTADSLPGLGIVAAVLGVIHTMRSIHEPPEVLGKLIGGAFMGTFLGVFLSYAIVGPLAHRLRMIIERDQQYYDCIRMGIVSYLQGSSPALAVEFARKALPTSVRPSFAELEEKLYEKKQGA